MNIFGVGGAELLAILIIMLVIAGPKRMIHWSYIMGKQVRKFRKIWSQTVDLVQKEFDEAGVGITLPKEPPTRQNLNKAIADAVQPVSKPLQDSIDEVKQDVGVFQEVSDSLNDKKAKPAVAAAASQDTKPAAKPARPKSAAAKAKTPEFSGADMGAWSGGAAGKNGDSKVNGSGQELGSWSARANDD